MMFAFTAAVFSISCIQHVLSQCPQNCQSCSITNHCLSCKVGYWATSLNCNYKCSNNCTDSKCDDKGYCYSCVDGMYGPNCNQECRLCMNGECGPRECTSGCKIGYYQYISVDYSYCMPCPVNCQQCLNSTYCTLCDDGYYIYKYTYVDGPRRGTAVCHICQFKTICDDCSKLSNCTQCSFDLVNITCEHCSAGYTLNNRQCVKNIACSEHCLNGCTVNGECNGCIDGKTGPTCDSTCNDRCAKCSQTNLEVCQTCENGFYTSTCDMSCPQNCANNQCDFNNGRCLNGCMSGFWGDRCVDRCSDRCTQSECNRDGTCSLECTAGYDGRYCNITITTTMTTVSTLSTTSESENKTIMSSLATIITTTQSSDGKTLKNEQVDSQLPVAAIGGGAGGGVVFITVVVVVIICIKRRKRNEKEDNNGIVVDRGETSNPVFDSEINNAESTYPTSTQPVDYIYAQPNKPKKQLINTASPEGPIDKTYSCIEIDMNGKDAGEETDTDETVELEDVDDGEADVIAAGENAGTVK